MPPLTVLLQTSRSGKIPLVGDGATLGIGSDCYPATIIDLNIKKGLVTVQQDIATPGPNYNYYSNQEYTYTPNPNGTIYKFSMRKNNRLTLIGDKMGTGFYLSLNGRRYYQDPSF